MYIQEGLSNWAKRVVKVTPPKELKKTVAWWYGQPVRFNKAVPATKPQESFQVWGKDVAKMHGMALKEAIDNG